MSNKNNIAEDLKMDMTTYKKVKGTMDPKTPVTITGDKPELNTTTMSEDVIEPKDKATIKYLSNVRDANTGKVSKPFTIGGKKYQLVRGTNLQNEVVMGVYSHDDKDENGNNVIHEMDIFEQTIAIPMKEKVDMENAPKPKEQTFISKPEATKPKSFGLGEYKHFIVNEKGGFRKFKELSELASATMGEGEKYMGAKQFKQYFEETVFGPSKRSGKTELNELQPVGTDGGTDDANMHVKAEKLMGIIKSKISSQILATINTPQARREVISAFGELLGVKRTELAALINTLKDIASTETTSVNTTSTEPVNEAKVIKTIKIKDVK